MKKCFLILMGILALMPAFSRNKVIRIAAAANLSNPMPELKAAFIKKYPLYEPVVSFGASGKFNAQIMEGADFQIFLSADREFPEALYEKGFAVTVPVIYASGKLILFSAVKRNFRKGLKSLLDKPFRVIVIANPKTAPYGKASIEALTRAGIYDTLKERIASADSISQVVQMVESAADAGFIAKSSIYSPDLARYNAEGTFWIDVDPALYDPIDQAMVILKPGRDQPEVQAFYDFILSREAQEIFKKYGYAVPNTLGGQ